MIIVLLIGGGLFAYALFYKLEAVAIVLFALIIANVNFDVPGMPLNMRALVTLALFGRIITDKKEMSGYPSFITSIAVKCFLTYVAYVLFISFIQELFTFELLKQTLSTVLATFCAYHFFFKKENTNILRTAMVIAGMICFADLAYTYIGFGSFPVQRLHLLISGGESAVQDLDEEGFFISAVNHNFFGQICGMAFIFIFGDLVKNKNSNKLMILLLPLMFLGILMSTSRSALLAVFVVVIIMVMNSVKHKEERKKVSKIATMAIGGIAAGILLFSTMGTYFKLDSGFVDEVIFRLADEPIAIIQKSLGQNYNVNNLGSMSWREEASADAYSAYNHLPFIEQVTGVGSGGFLKRDMGHGLNPHNGVLLILIETGMIGLLLYVILIGSILWRAVGLKNISPSFAIIVFTLIYGVGQNEELTSSTTFLFVSTLIAENRFRILQRDEEEVYDTDAVMA